MSPETSGVFIGAGAILLAGLLTWLGVALARLWKVPKRIDRIEAMNPMMLEALMLLFDVNVIELECQQGKECNGDLTIAVNSIKAFKDRVTKFLAAASISQKGPK